jgi:hypothetical protein
MRQEKPMRTEPNDAVPSTATVTKERDIGPVTADTVEHLRAAGASEDLLKLAEFYAERSKHGALWRLFHAGIPA